MNGGRRKGRTFPIRRSNDDCRSAVRQDFDDGALFPTKKSKGSFCRGFAANHMNMKTSTRKRIGRVGILAVLALLLLVCFASCAPNNAQKVTLSYDGDTFLSVAENQDQHALKVTQFKELADLLEVIYACAKARGYTVAELESVRAEKAAKRGRFDKKILLKTVTED